MNHFDSEKLFNDSSSEKKWMQMIEDIIRLSPSSSSSSSSYYYNVTLLSSCCRRHEKRFENINMKDAAPARGLADRLCVDADRRFTATSTWLWLCKEMGGR
jgi:hypothetical protein